MYLRFLRQTTFATATLLTAWCCTTSLSSESAQESTEANFRVMLETVIQENDEESLSIDFIWTQARAAWVPTDTPYAIMTMSQKLKTGDDVYYDLYQTLSYDSGQTWTVPQEIPSLKLHTIDNNYRRSLSDMTPQWHPKTGRILNIGKSFFYTDDSTPDRSRREVAYAVYDPETQQWGSHQALDIPTQDTSALSIIAPNAGCVQWLMQPNGEILLPIFYYKMSAEQAATTDRTAYDVGNNMNNDELSQMVAVLRCSFDGEKLTFLELGEELQMKQGRGLGEPSLAYLNGTYFLTLRTDQSAYVTRSSDGLHYEELQEWTFDDGSVLGSYNTQQHWATHDDRLFLSYTRRGADNDGVFRHRAPLFIAEVDPQKLVVLRDTEQEIVPNRGVGLGNFGVTKVDGQQIWITTTEYMRGETNVAADNSVFVARLLANQP
ncbi:exo-alpha-sialidase [Tunicatimonas pelagia]|uniref:exo-alpha-sialidase n=1 Tax=Tunicatimonas pelagia TaxID=931531 RepID=UPI002666E8FC|nr:exo-alpha-sialidase [Tunicatimonas pelagia]WKN44209.1 exo-alpha-sialidase [Tunicatimonas pelagia]